jgi:hypothetical protein
MLCDMFKHFDMSSPIDATVWCLFLQFGQCEVSLDKPFNTNLKGKDVGIGTNSKYIQNTE